MGVRLDGRAHPLGPSVQEPSSAIQIAPTAIVRCNALRLLHPTVLATRYQLDPLGRRLASRAHRGTGLGVLPDTQPLGSHLPGSGTETFGKTYRYDPTGELREAQHPLKGQARYDYDPTGRLEAVLRTGGAGPTGPVTRHPSPNTTPGIRPAIRSTQRKRPGATGYQAKRTAKSSCPPARISKCGYPNSQIRPRKPHGMALCSMAPVPAIFRAASRRPGPQSAIPCGSQPGGFC